MINIYSLSLTLLAVIIAMLIFTAAGGPPGFNFGGVRNPLQPFEYYSQEQLPHHHRPPHHHHHHHHRYGRSYAPEDSPVAEVNKTTNGSFPVREEKAQGILKPLHETNDNKIISITTLNDSNSLRKEESTKDTEGKDKQIATNENTEQESKIIEKNFGAEVRKALGRVKKEELICYPTISAHEILDGLSNSIMGLAHVADIYDARHDGNDEDDRFYSSDILKVALTVTKQNKIQNVTAFIARDRAKLQKKKPVMTKIGLSPMGFTEEDSNTYERLIKKFGRMKAKLGRFMTVAKENQNSELKKNQAEEYLKQLKDTKGFDASVELGYDTVDLAFDSYTDYIARTIEEIDSLVSVMENTLEEGLEMRAHKLYHENVYLIYNFLRKDMIYIKRLGIVLELVPSTTNGI